MPPRRNMRKGYAKRDVEAGCRVCADPRDLEVAHVIARAHVRPGPGEDEANLVPLCGPCHRLYDGRKLDLLPYLSIPEQASAVALGGGIITALQRVTGESWYPAYEEL